jgi:Na+-transporting NADH:ubiquinone oxidoreductase subunit B
MTSKEDPTEVVPVDVKKLFMKQKMMRTVLVALVPILVMAIFLWGWRIIMLGVITVLTAVISEYLVMRTINKEKTKVSEAAFVSAALFTLTLPPETPVWVAIVGIVFGIVFGKTVFGGFGRNIFNPALAGRCFIYVAFPTQMTMTWAQPFKLLPGGFASWLPMESADAVAAATPIISHNAGEAPVALQDLFLGIIPGSMGETCAVLILLMGAFLVYKKVASWHIMVSTILSGGVFSAILHYAGVMSAAGVRVTPPLFLLLSGGYLFGAVFMATDPISAPKLKSAQIAAGIMIGIITVIIRAFSLFTEGMMFAILVVNALTPLLELKIKQFEDRKRLPAKEAAT